MKWSKTMRLEDQNWQQWPLTGEASRNDDGDDFRIHK